MTARWRAALLAAVLGVPTLAGASAAADDLAVENAVENAVEHVVVVGVPGLSWDDVSEQGTPQLWQAADDGSIGALTVRSARSTTCVLDGWLTLGAGNRARYVDPQLEGRPPPEVPQGCLPQQSLDEIELAAAVADQEGAGENSFGAEPGALGAAVPCATGVGPGPVLALSGPGADIELTPAAPASSGRWSELITRCPLTVVALPALVDGGDRAGALGGIDATIGELRDGLPAATEVLIVGTSETGLATSQLHVAIEFGPAAGSGYLTSASTGRTPYVQLIDVAPTVLDRLGIDAPPEMVGQPFQPEQDRAGSLPDVLAELRDADLAARAHLGATSPFFTLLVLVNALLCAVAFLSLRRRRATGRSMVRLAALAVGALPVATFLANVAPWWRADAAPVVLAGSVAVAVAGVTAVAAAGPWRRHPLGPALAVVVVTVLTLSLDVVLGSSLQLNSLLSYNPIVAGRFTGLGNLAYGAFGTAVLLGTAALLHGRPRRVQLALGVAAAVTVVVIVGGPWFGTDFGGVLALVPAFAVLTMIALRLPLSPARLAAAGLAGVAAVTAIAFFDYLRPAADRTHLGRFVGQLLDGSGLTVIERKAGANINVLLNSPLTLLIPIFGLTLWWLLRPGGLLRALVDRHVEARAGLWAAAVSGLVGLAVNDSGIAIPVVGGCLLVPLALAVAASSPHPQEAVVRSDGESAPVREPQGVTVNSRDVAGRPD